MTKKSKHTEQTAVESDAKQALRIARLAMERIDGLAGEISVAKIAGIESRVDKLTNRLDQIKPIKTQPHGAMLEVNLETKRQMAAEAQNLGLRSADELTQIVLHAFIDLCQEDNSITFPLMLQQVPTL